MDELGRIRHRLGRFRSKGSAPVLEGVEDQPRDEMGKWTAGQHVEHIQKLADTGIKAMQEASEKTGTGKGLKGMRAQFRAVSDAYEPHDKAVVEHVEKAKKALHPKYHKQIDKTHKEVRDRFGAYLRAHM